MSAQPQLITKNFGGTARVFLQVEGLSVAPNGTESWATAIDGSLPGVLGKDVRSFGAVGGSGTVDDTTAIQNTITAAISSSKLGNTVFLPAGTYRITSTLNFRDAQGIRFVGAGYGTIILWDGNNTDPALFLDSVKACSFENFQLQPKTGVTNAVGVRMIQSAGLTSSRHNRFERVNIGGQVVCVQIGGSGVDLNNDSHTFRDCNFVNYTTCGWSLEGTQVYAIRIDNCISAGAAGARCALQSDAFGGLGGGFVWTGGGGGGHSTADFCLGAPTNQPNVIENAWWENSNRFIVTGGPSGAARTLRVTGNRWSGDAVNADGEFIRFWYPGPLIIKENRFGDGSPAATQLKIDLQPTLGSAALWYFVVNHNSVRYNEFTYPHQLPTTASGSQVY
jgi:hypothetical protein